MKLIRFPAVHQTLMVAFCTRDFLHLHNGALIAAGTVHYDAVTNSGFWFAKPMYDYSDLPEQLRPNNDYG
jgi:hypothetical protein